MSTKRSTEEFRVVVAKAGKLVMGTLGIGLTASATLLDQLAWALCRAPLSCRRRSAAM